MDKSTDSTNTTGNRGSSSGETPPQTCKNISLGCGPSTTSATAAGNGSGSTGASSSASTAAASTSSITASSLHANRTSSMKASSSGATLPANSNRVSLLPIYRRTPLTTLSTAALLQAATTHLAHIHLNISTTTGGNFGVQVDPQISVENLKKIIAKKLKVAKDRICLLHREKELQDGTLKGNNLVDGSKIILIPNVETGLLTQRPENTVMQALESLNDSQVNDFLSGKTPLNLSMRFGDHMMLIQLQLSTVNPANGGGSTMNGNSCNSSRTRSSQRSSSSRSTSSSASASGAHNHHNHSHSHHHHHHHHHHGNNATGATASAVPATATTLGGSGGSDSSSSSPSASGSGTGTTTTTTATGGATDAPSLWKLPVVDRSGYTATTSTEGGGITHSTKETIKRDFRSIMSRQNMESFQNIIKNIALSQSSRLAVAQSVASAAMLSKSTSNLTTSASANVNSCLSGTSNSGSGSGSINTSASQSLRNMATVVSPAVGGFHTASESPLLEQSPIKSLSNLVSSPIKTTAIKNIPIANGSSSSSSSSSSLASATSPSAPTACQDPFAAMLTSCLCTRLMGSNLTMTSAGQSLTMRNCADSVCLSSRQDSVDGATASSATTLQSASGATPAAVVSSPSAMLTSTPNFKAESAAGASLLHKTANNPITRSKYRHHHHHHHHHHHYHLHSGSADAIANNARAQLATAAAATRCTSASSNDSGIAMDESPSTSPVGTISGSASSILTPQAAPKPVGSSTSSTSTGSTTIDLDDSGLGLGTSDTRTLAEASRNLTQTLRKLSKEVFTNKIEHMSGDDTVRKSGSGAVIESMKNHGKGIYSGTFSGTLNPALQDRYGRPKRDISTVIHILNDLLSATPQYSRGARISFETPSTSSASSSATGSVTASHGIRPRQITSKHHHSCFKCYKNNAPNTSASLACPYGDCGGRYSKSSGSSKSSLNCCQDLTMGSSAGHNHHASNERNICSCRYRVTSETGEREREHTCQKCLIEMENRKTKSKMDQLRLVMQQRKQKREARKLKGAPYGARVVGAAATATTDATGMVGNVTDAATASLAAAATTTPLATASASASTATAMSTSASPPSEVPPNHIVEEVDTAA